MAGQTTRKRNTFTICWRRHTLFLDLKKILEIIIIIIVVIVVSRRCVYYAVVTCERKLFQNYFSLRRRPTEIIVFQRVETCLKLFQNYFRTSLQLMHIFQHVQCRRNNFEMILSLEIVLFQFQTWLQCEIVY